MQDLEKEINGTQAKKEPVQKEFKLSENMTIRIITGQQPHLEFKHLHNDSTFIGMMGEKSEMKKLRDALNAVVG